MYHKCNFMLNRLGGPEASLSVTIARSPYDPMERPNNGQGPSCHRWWPKPTARRAACSQAFLVRVLMRLPCGMPRAQACAFIPSLSEEEEQRLPLHGGGGTPLRPSKCGFQSWFAALPDP
jgi:hypothetical protein